MLNINAHSLDYRNAMAHTRKPLKRLTDLIVFIVVDVESFKVKKPINHCLKKHQETYLVHTSNHTSIGNTVALYLECPPCDAEYRVDHPMRVRAHPYNMYAKNRILPLPPCCIVYILWSPLHHA